MAETKQWTIGDVVVTKVEESVVPVPRYQLIPDTTDEQIAAARPWIDPYVTADNELLLSVHAFVVQAGTTTIVVDTCVGVDPPRRLPGDAAFPDRLAAAINGGLEAVDIVLCTHLHFDHVGWNTRVVDGERVPTFPNARYVFAQIELDHLDAEGDSHELRDESVQSLLDAGLVDLIELDHTLTPSSAAEVVRTVATPGHTPGHVSVVIESGGERAVITGDAVHNPIQLAFPELAATRFDWDSEQSTSTRREFIDRFGDVLVLGTHFASPSGGHIKRNDDGGVEFR